MMDFDCIFVVEKISQKELKNKSQKHDAIQQESLIPILKDDKSPFKSVLEKEEAAKASSEKIIKLAFWIDQNWEGVWLNVCNIKDTSCSVFVLNHCIQKQQSSSLCPREGIREVSTSVKMQFFTTPDAKSMTSMPDFRFMSACPLSFFKERGHIFRLGLWNYNLQHCDDWGLPLNDYLLTIVNRGETTVPSSISLQCTLHSIPSLEYHNKVTRVNRWIKDVLENILPEEKSIFKTLRTYCRSPWMTLFFFDLHKLYETKGGTNLPPVMALYIVCNSCIIHQIELKEFLGLLCMDERTPDEMETMLSIVRDIIMCFTICQREGQYRDDKSLGVIVEDQPFSFSFRPGNNVFDEDDCEGHDQQGCVHVKGLFQHIARDHRESNLHNVREQVQTSMDACLCVDPESIEDLLAISVRLGNMFEVKVLDAIMCVGEANFTSFQQVKDVNVWNEENKNQVDGHSFGILLYRRADDQVEEAMVLETTGWECRGKRKCGRRSVLPNEIKKKAQKTVEMMIGGYVSEISKNKEHYGKGDTIICQTIINKSMEDRLYVRVFAGDECIFFTYTAHTDELSYGASPSDIAERSIQYKGESKSTLQEKYAGCRVALMVSPEQFLQSLNDMNSPWAKHKGAREILGIYKEIRAMYPSFHQCLMPPQITEEEFMRRIGEYWGIITQEDLDNMSRLNQIENAGGNEIILSCKVMDPHTRECTPNVNDLIERICHWAYIKTHEFMHSKVIVIKPCSL